MLGGTLPADEIEWWIAAYHESGHAISRLHFSMPFGRVRIYPMADGRVWGSVTYREPHDRYLFAITCVCGPLAEARLTNVGIGREVDSRRDLEMAAEALGEPVDIILPAARWLVDYRWPTIVRVARALAAAGEMSYKEIRRLV